MVPRPPPCERLGSTLRGRPLRIDGFNLILTLESALGGGIVLGGRDGCYRDLASVHGTYRRVEETRPALDLSTRLLADLGTGPVPGTSMPGLQ